MNETLRDIKGPLSLNGHLNIFLLLGLLVLLAVLAFLFLSRRKNVGVIVRKRPAHEIAYEQLEKLKAKDLVRQGKIKEYYSEVSDIIRRYLENRFLLKAPEMTTEEFLFYVRDYSQLVSAYKASLRGFLTACDLVKFAKYIPTFEEMDAIFVSAKKLVDETKVALSIGRQTTALWPEEVSEK
ncbi:MAG: hypothetical protein AUJ74_01920 [Candidatus Omnitrophica bacterium CG1_02_44_16]|nr:MAG: hypothetical protein AUJ74_01920 [Candidatus Omnitrophica bacterium CG1_02_44_16]PIY83564.1 MAG: hypothetical protein COY78_01855 [Candidatus Omnitrophica bacterium CG_4_10_14_0_8_um_filter_44_12]PIZ83966.1 MAG: hypothetical protein COX96_06220 [Candidatus Omnitrophica bacterium CG_4_10_14_0_2_um_filter_44_9]